jgi:hypothetical protein
MKPLPAPDVPGDTEAARMDNAVRMLFSASKADFVKQESKHKQAKERKKRAKKAVDKRIAGALIATQIV